MKIIFSRLLSVIIVIIISCNFSYSQKKDFVYLKSPFLQNNVIKSDLEVSKNDDKKHAVDITKYLPPDFVKDASKDYTIYIQKGLDENKIVRMPNFPLMINESGLKLKSGSRIIFQKESSLNMKPNSLESYSIVKLSNVNDVKIYSPFIIGERDKHTGNKGEWGMGINILSSTNIQIICPKIYNCWGDGIYVGRGENGPSKKVKIINAEIDNCRRNGISITDGEYIEISNSKISNTNGTLPMCGIDIEPNDNNAIIDNIKILNPLTFNNSNAGISLYLNQLPGKLKKNVNIRIENHIDDSSDLGIIIDGFNERKETIQQLGGSIDIINPEWKNNRYPVYAGTNLSMGPKINLKNHKIENSKVDPQKIREELSHKKNLFINIP
jgi:hypothetical protein